MPPETLGERAPLGDVFGEYCSIMLTGERTNERASELVFVVEEHLEEKVDNEQQPEFNPHQSSSAAAAGRGGMFLAMRASNSTSSLKWVSNT